MRIFLVGYMGSGKSTAGKIIAEKLGMQFADLDEHVEQENGQSISEIFEKEGEEHFRELEHNALKSFFEPDNIIISTGGGTPCFYDNMDLMNRNGITVYIKMSVDSLVERLANAKHKRPLIKDMSEFDLRSFISTNLEKRESFYLKAQYKVKGKNLDALELAGFLQRELSINA